MNKKIIKRDGREEDFKDSKIVSAIEKSFISQNSTLSDEESSKILNLIHEAIDSKEKITVEDIQDEVEKALMSLNFYDIAKAYILYRNSRTQIREYRDFLVKEFNKYDLRLLFKNIEKEYPTKEYSLLNLANKYKSFSLNSIDDEEKMNILIKSALELVSVEAPKWDLIAGRIELFRYHLNLKTRNKEVNVTNFYSKIKYLIDNDYYGSYLLEKYNEEEINKIERMIIKSRDKLLSYSSFEVLKEECLIKDKNGNYFETPQEMFMAIAMHLAMNEKDKLFYVKRFYDVLSKFEFVFALPILKNARRKNAQLSNCFIDIMDDSIVSIFESISNLAKTYDLTGGMGIYLGKLRSTSYLNKNSEENVGILKWLKIINDVVLAINKKGGFNGGVTCYLDIWHIDILDFLEIRKYLNLNKHYKYIIYPAICVPDYFWKLARDNINAMWSLMDPHEIYLKKNYHLEDYYGVEWENRYLDCVHDDRIIKKDVPIKEIIRLIVKNAFETGTPFCFNRDIANKENPNKHKGMIYSSNLCLEIMQNVSPKNFINEEVMKFNGEEVLIKKSEPSNYPTSVLGSICLMNFDYSNDSKLEDVISIGIRALDNCIDLTSCFNLNSLLTLKKYRSLGISVNGYQDVLVNENIKFDSEEQLIFGNKLFEKINYFALKASNALAIEKGSYPYFKGSDFDNGNYFINRDYLSEKWAKLKDSIKNKGLRNGYLLALSSLRFTSILSSNSESILPLLSKFYFEEEANKMIPRVSKFITNENNLYYSDAFDISQDYIIKTAQMIYKHIDQGISLNLYINSNYSMRQILDLYIKAYEAGIKSIHFLRLKEATYE